MALTAGNVLQRHAYGLGEEAHETQANAVLLLEKILVFVARLDDRAHVDIVEGREQRGGLLRTLEALGDGLTQTGHLYALFAALARRRKTRPGSLEPRWWWPMAPLPYLQRRQPAHHPWSSGHRGPCP
jgi:hypothetical protein